MSVFVAVAERQSFAAAARELDLTPPVVTRTIAALEEHLGVQLLLRTTRQVSLTQAGEGYLEDCRRVLALIGEVEAAVSGAHAEPKGQVTLTASTLFGGMYVAPLVRRFLDAHPQLSGRMLFLDRVVNLVDEGVDVAVRMGALPDSSLRAVRVGAVRRVMVAAPSYLERVGAPQTPHDFKENAPGRGCQSQTTWID